MRVGAYLIRFVAVITIPRVTTYLVAEFVGQYHGWAIPIPEKQGYVN